MRNLPEGLQVVIVVFVLAFMALQWLARKRPDIQWLQAFDVTRGLTEEQKRRFRRRNTAIAGGEIILLGVLIPLGFFVVKVMLATGTSTIELLLVTGSSLFCIFLGVYVIARSLRA